MDFIQVVVLLVDSVAIRLELDDFSDARHRYELISVN